MLKQDHREVAEGSISSDGGDGAVSVARPRGAWKQGWEHYFDTASDLLCVASPDGYFRDLNPRWERLLGYTVAELCAMRFFDLLHPDDIESTGAAMAQAVSGEVTLDGLINRYRRKDGSYAQLEWKSAVVVRGLCYCVAHDVSAREESRQALSTALERLQYLQHASGVCLFAIDMRGGTHRVTFLSENVSDLFGYTEEEFRQEPQLWECRLHPEDRARAVAETAALMNHGTCLREYRWQRKDGTYCWVRDETKLVRDKGGQPIEVVGTWQDITGRKEVEVTLERQACALVELSTPLIPISEDILVMPLIGMVDSRRADQIMATLLHGISSRHARFTILDITGVGVVDTNVAAMLMRTARAARLLGVEVLLTGIRGDVARTLVALDVDLGTVVTFGTLQAGIQHALRRVTPSGRR
ncbi:PAS domain-containing protein [Chondromyces apiculatus]|uniref:Anti-sigma-factor antagonist n=1 Tax=Chondromyces apiculatus DSM 436 TaxID=1192034 RepID=A0A017T1P5_9BACT|nr:PAS domain-containing protein [Chondromyces apiculatus]EYF03133.1 anti-sigma-factor antagonist [Chondromyces apiculatus DSM 436]